MREITTIIRAFNGSGPKRSETLCRNLLWRLVTAADLGRDFAKSSIFFRFVVEMIKELFELTGPGMPDDCAIVAFKVVKEWCKKKVKRFWASFTQTDFFLFRLEEICFGTEVIIRPDHKVISDPAYSDWARSVHKPLPFQADCANGAVVMSSLQLIPGHPGDEQRVHTLGCGSYVLLVNKSDLNWRKF